MFSYSKTYRKLPYTHFCRIMEYFNKIKTSESAVNAFSKMNETLDTFCNLFDNGDNDLNLTPVYKMIIIQIKDVHKVSQPFNEDNKYSSILLSSLKKAFQVYGFEGSNEECFEKMDKYEEDDWVIIYLGYIQEGITEMKINENITKDKSKKRRLN